MKPMQRQKNQLYREIDPDGTVSRSTDRLVALAKEQERAAAGIPPSMRSNFVPESLIQDIKNPRPTSIPRQAKTLGAAELCHWLT